ncbi:MAG TPA: GNAT family N-acetyltransferase [Candidatus Udaeobacter sp.]|nr:GNAT family N-acetyltransferase [Candidatus Udaeobacter sp.]
MESSAVLRPAAAGEKAAMRAMLADHLRELRAFGPVEEPYPYFDVYWTEATRWPYLIEVACEPIGFVMVNQWSPSGRGTDHAIAEFYIAPAHRRLGHGMEAARQAFRAHPGRWELSIFAANQPAQAFWPAAIASAGGRALERFDHQGNTVLRFVVGA